MKFFRFDRQTGDIEIVETNPRAAPPSLTKGELVRQVAGELDLTQAEVSAVVGCLLAKVTEGLKSGRSVMLSGFGRFKPRKCRSGKFRNPKTGKTAKLQGRRSVSFRPSSRLKQRLG